VAGGLARRILRDAVALNRSGLALGRSLHLAVGVAGPLAVGVATGHALEGVAVAGGAVVVGFTDLGGPYPARLRLMLITAVLVTASSFVGFLAGQGDWPAVVALGLWGFAAGLIVALGQAPAFAALAAALGLLLAEDFPCGVHEALRRAAYVLAGGLIQAVLAILLWPFRPALPEREAAAAACDGLAVVAGEWPEPPRSSAFIPAAARAESMLAAHRTWGARRTEVANRLRRFTDGLERIYGELIALQDERRRVTSSDAAVLDSAVAGVGHALRSVAHALRRRRRPPAVAVEASAAEAGALSGPAGRSLHAIQERVRELATLASGPDVDAAVAPARQPRADPMRHGSARAILRANLTRDSMAFRHGVRLGVTLAGAVLTYRVLPLGRGYWVPLTVIFVLRPDFGATFTRGLQRYAGTAIGVVLATLVAVSLKPGDWVETVLIGVFSWVCYAFLFANYGIFTAAVTALIVFFVSLEGVSTYTAIVDRTIDTAIGGALALGAFLFWPTWEGKADVGANVATLLDRQEAFVVAVLADAVEPGRDRGATEDARSAARLARTNAEASLERALSQPERTRGDLASLTGVLYATRSLGDAILATDARLGDEPRREPMPALAGLADALTDTLAAVARAVREQDLPATAGLRGTHEALPDDVPAWIVRDTAEMVESIETMVQLLDGARERPPASASVQTT
jgi:uncharacterized membrane protein YccC